MTGFGTGVMRPVERRPDEETAARCAIAWRVEAGLLDAEGAANVLFALGLAPQPDPPGKPARGTGTRFGAQDALRASGVAGPPTAAGDTPNGPQRSNQTAETGNLRRRGASTPATTRQDTP